MGALASLAPDRLLAIQDEGRASERQRLLVLDPAGGRLATAKPLAGSVVALAQGGRRLVLAVAPAQGIGPAELVVADGRGRVRRLPLGLDAGFQLLAGQGHGLQQQLPGLAVDPLGERAFVVGPEVVIEVDLRRLAVSRRPLAGRALAARATTIAGWRRQARWLGRDLMAVSGWDMGEPGGTKPAGLAVIDTRTWQARLLEPGATDFLFASGLLLATGSTYDPTTGETSSIGLAAFTPDGEERFRLFDGESVWVVQGLVTTQHKAREVEAREGWEVRGRACGGGPAARPSRRGRAGPATGG